MPTDGHTLAEPELPQPDLWRRLKALLFGRPLATSVHLEHRLPIVLALPVFASDALSSVAYATEEVLIVLAAAMLPGGLAGTGYLIPISLGIAVLMVIVATSYRRAILLYPQSGGSYTVARRNLGANYGMMAGSALIIDYILTVAVSVSAGVAALTSYFPQLEPSKVLLGIALVAFVTLINLRGVRESGIWFALPAYTFVSCILLVILASLYHYLTGTVVPAPLAPDAVLPNPAHSLAGWAGVLLLAKAFSNGCSALTGVEAVSNGVGNFQPPEAQNAAKTLAVLIGTLVTLFLGLGFAASVYGVLPVEGGETVISQVARAAFASLPGGSALYALTIGATLAVLMVASNTAFAGLPQLLAMMARDGYAPRVLLGQGDRLVYNRSIIGLAVISAGLIVLFKASVNLLIPLYAVGVFLCFTLSQAGMFRRMVNEKAEGWRQGAFLNGFGAVVTGIVTLVIAGTKFSHGAWLVCVLIPAFMFVSRKIKEHYQWFEGRMALRPGDPNPLAGPLDHLTVLVLLSSDIHKGTLEGLEAARALAEGRKNSMLRALHIEIDPEKTKRLKSKFEQFVEPYLGRYIQLDIIPSPYRWLIEPVVDYINQIDRERHGDRIIVVVPEFETGDWFSHLLHNQTAARLRAALFNRPNITILSHRFFMRPPAQTHAAKQEAEAAKPHGAR